MVSTSIFSHRNYTEESASEDSEDDESNEEEEEEEEEEEDQEEEEEDEEVEEEQEKKVELSRSSVTLLPDLLEFERCERPGAHGEGDKCSSGSSLQALSHGPSRFPHRKGLGMGLAEGLEKVLKPHLHSTCTVFP